jgi:hypothetical protein
MKKMKIKKRRKNKIKESNYLLFIVNNKWDLNNLSHI